MSNADPIPRPALVLGWLGVLPFAAFAMMAATGMPLAPDPAARALVLYGAVILSFMGGAQWGLAMAATTGQAWRLTISVLPALVAFALSFLPAIQALTGLAAAFVALLAYDMSTARTGTAPAWYPALRLRLTIAVVACLLIPAMSGRA